MFKTQMDTPATPERVYALYQLLRSLKAAEVKDLKEKMEPDSSAATQYFGQYSGTAIELGLIKRDDNNNYLVNTEIEGQINSLADFRQYVNKQLSKFDNEEFYRITKAYVQIYPKLYGNEKMSLTEESTLNLIRKYDREHFAAHDERVLEKRVNPTILAWRFWASFLGFGFLDDNSNAVYLNPAIYLQDLIKMSDLKSDTTYSLDEFLNALEPGIDLLLTEEQKKNKVIPFGLDAALKTLDGVSLELISILDESGWHSQLPDNMGNTGTDISAIKVTNKEAVL